jgi:hypothetical protein
LRTAERRLAEDPEVRAEGRKLIQAFVKHMRPQGNRGLDCKEFRQGKESGMAKQVQARKQKEVGEEFIALGTMAVLSGSEREK